MPEFKTKIMNIRGGMRYLITVPKKLVESKVINPDIVYLVKLEEIPIIKTPIKEKAEVKN